jgi:hypothetical protein
VPLGAYPPRRSTKAPGEGAFAGIGSTRGLRLEQTLGEGFAERKWALADRIPALDEDPESCSECLISNQQLCMLEYNAPYFEVRSSYSLCEL